MTIDLDSELEAKLTTLAEANGMAPDEYVRLLLRQQVVPQVVPRLSDEEFERRLRSIASDCGASLTNEQLSREEMYD